MANSLKITADTSEVKKSLLDLGKSMKDIKGSKVAIFNSDDKKFLKSELKKELSLMKTKLKENREEISRMVDEQNKLVRGGKDELELRKKILDAYKTQAKLGKQLGEVQKSKTSMSTGGGGGGGILASIGGMISKIPGLAVLATAALAISKTMEATSQYTGGAANRVKLKGLGVKEDQFGSPEALARVGLSEQDMIQRRIEATRTLGREGTTNEGEMKKAGFERAFGLEGGTMTGVASQLRGQQGGKAASDTVMKLQASILAAGIEDAIGPYLETTTKLLGEINENGMTSTDQMISLMATMTKDGQRTPEQIAKTFSNINTSVQNATGEKSAFLQTAFARAGIGGGTLGGTKFAMESGGVMGLNREELEKRGYNKKLLDNMQKTGMFSGAGERTGGILEQFKRSGGLKAGQSVNDVTDMNQMIGLSNLANNVMGTKGMGGFDALKLMEQVQNKQMSRKTFDEKMKKIQEDSDPVAKRLDEINETLAGQTDVLTNINENIMEGLGKEGAVTRNQLVGVENMGLKGVSKMAGAANDTGVIQHLGGFAQGKNSLVSGNLGGWLYDKLHPNEAQESEQDMAPVAQQNIPPSAKEIGDAVATALQKAPISNQNNITVKTHMGDGKVSERTTK